MIAHWINTYASVSFLAAKSTSKTYFTILHFLQPWQKKKMLKVFVNHKLTKLCKALMALSIYKQKVIFKSARETILHPCVDFWLITIAYIFTLKRLCFHTLKKVANFFAFSWFFDDFFLNNLSGTGNHFSKYIDFTHFSCSRWTMETVLKLRKLSSQKRC